MNEENKARKKRMNEYRRRYREKHGIKVRRYRWKTVLGVIAAFCIMGFSSFFAAQSKAAGMVTLNGQAIKNLTADDVQRYLDEQEKKLTDRSVKLQSQDIDASIALPQIDAKLDRERIDDGLYLVGRTGSPGQRVADVIATLRFGKEVPLAVQVDEDKLDKAVSTIYNTYNIDPENAYAVPNGDTVSVTIHKEKNRIVIDADALKKSIFNELQQGKTETIEVPVEKREDAAVKEEDLKAVDTVLSYYTTHFSDSDQNRNENIAIAQKRLNHAFVPAQKDFSFNQYVGTRTLDKGYKEAPAYFDNKLVPASGGGVCQVSTTLFNAVLRAGLVIASRSPHFAPAGYVPVGMDATVADDSLDFAFTNPFQHPVYVYTAIGNGSITTYILGNHADTCTVSFQTLSVKNLPHKVVYKHDDAATTDKVDQEGYDGHDIAIRRTVSYTDGDHYTDTIVSHYDPNTEIILTNGPGSESTVQTSDLEAQDLLLNDPHDMMTAVAAVPDSMEE